MTFLNGRITLQLTIISACQTKNVKLLLSLEAFVIIADFRSACHVECQKMVSKFVLRFLNRHGISLRYEILSVGDVTDGWVFYFTFGL